MNSFSSEKQHSIVYKEGAQLGLGITNLEWNSFVHLKFFPAKYSYMVYETNWLNASRKKWAKFNWEKGEATKKNKLIVFAIYLLKKIFIEYLFQALLIQNSKIHSCL